ncbi:SRPBCC domain-containing protein [Hoeflea sp. YIM 152468]|uniref:SRPBCC family protein n=1 Tax=Hoeflea sp. YIM 152468 TaxID=3031759 RepID=UPI0023DBAC2F|nr:SRPBCC domain-containing protein [Hoeflea sp. YIM 152468]MDF1608357.1 SRPBCC domain-containing protein [Hoeflea sp. YIM 152468]
MTDAIKELELTVSRKISAPRTRVFDAWLSPPMLAKFMRPGGSDMTSKVTNDPVKGGRFTILMATAEKEIPHAGTYLEIDPHSRLSFTWESPYSLDDSVVTIDFTEIEPGVTEVTLHQVKFRSEEARNGHLSGWTAILDALEETIG